MKYSGKGKSFQQKIVANLNDIRNVRRVVDWEGKYSESLRKLGK